jgi:hypothetical protein
VSSALDAAGFLAETGRPAQVAAVSVNRVPLLGSLWYLFEAGRFWFSSMSGSPLAMAAMRSAEVAVIVDDFDPPSSIRQVRIRGASQIEDHDLARVRRIYARYLGADDTAWPEFFRHRLTDARWILWSVWADSGLVVSTPDFRGEEYRWQARADSPL